MMRKDDGDEMRGEINIIKKMCNNRCTDGITPFCWQYEIASDSRGIPCIEFSCYSYCTRIYY